MMKSEKIMEILSARREEKLELLAEVEREKNSEDIDDKESISEDNGSKES